MFVVLRVIIICIAGILLGSVVNMGLITVGPTIIPPPEGVDVSNMESMAASMHLFQFKHFVFPFLAHALGTLAGAILVGLLIKHRKGRGALFIGLFFLAGGIAASTMIPAPLWFIVADLVLAFIPMAWLGLVIARRLSHLNPEQHHVG